jgi:hypothetical protein
VRLLRVADGWPGAALLFVLGLADYWIQALAWPLQRGRDSWDYWLYFLQFLDRHPPFSQVMLFRTPVTPIVTGLPMLIGGGRFLEVVMSVIYAASVLGWAWAVRPFGRGAAITMAVVVLVLQLPYAALFHEVSSDFVFGAILPLWAGLVIRAARSPSSWVLAGLGLASVGLTLARPAGQVVVLSAALAALVAPGPVRARLGRLGITLAAALIPLLLWAGVNGLRYGDFTVARGGKAWVPFYKVFGAGRIDPNAGPASRKLALAVEQQVLTLPQYRKLHVGVRTYFESPENLEAIRLVALSDQVFGRASNYDVLLDAATEEIRKDPGWYATDVVKTFWHFLDGRFALDRVLRHQVIHEESPVRVIDGKPRPSPIALSPLVQAIRFGFVWCPTNDIDRCILRHPSVAFRLRRDQRRYLQLVHRVRDWNAQLPLRDGKQALASKLDSLSVKSPRSFVWILIGIGALVIRRPRRGLVLAVLLLAAGLVLLVHALSQFPQSEYELPLAPLFVLVAVAAVLGTRSRSAER